MSSKSNTLLGRIFPRFGKAREKKRAARQRNFRHRLGAEMLEDRRMLAGNLFINEIMADNDAIIEDPNEAEAFEDWVEIYASSAEFVGKLRFGKMSKLMIQSGFDSFKGPKAESFSHGQFGFEVQTLHGTGRNLSTSLEPVHQEGLMFA